ncbi:MAG TPA: hypothetical protein VFC38_04740 [Stellaceae bacterium]|nr:hypothetical protein [Stellaceae bacterium]
MTGIVGLRDFAARLRGGETEASILGPVSNRTAKLVAPAGKMSFVDEASRSARFAISNPSVDLAADSIDENGWVLDNFNKNSLVLWNHDSSTPAIARAVKTGLEGKELMSTAIFAPRDVHPLADTVYQLIKLGFLRAASVGFIPLSWSFSGDKNRIGGIDIKRQSLLEWSICNIPCNPDCLVVGRAKGIDTTPMAKWATRALDQNQPGLMSRQNLEDIRSASLGRPIPRRSATPAERQATARRHKIEAELLLDGYSAPTPAERHATARRHKAEADLLLDGYSAESARKIVDKRGGR